MTTRLLLAEDNVSLSQMLQQFLAAQKFDVLVATTGVETLQALASQEVDLLLLDLRLPELSGIDVLQKLRKSPKWSSLPVIIMTGVYKGTLYAEAARKLGVAHYLEKPFTQQAFLQAIRSALAKSPPPAEPPALRELVADIYNHRRSGLLSSPEGPPVSFVRGEPISFHSRGREDFPSFLVSRGKISTTEMKLFVESCEERLFFTQAGFLSYDDLVEESRLFLSKCLTDLLAHNGPGEFSEGATEMEVPFASPLSIPELIYEASRHNVSDADTSRFTAKWGEHYPARTTRFYRHANLMTMQNEDIEVLSRIDGTHSVNDLLATTTPRNEAAAFLRFFLTLDMIALHNTPAEEASPDFPQKTLFNRPIEEIIEFDDPTISFDDVVEEVSGTVELAVGTEGMGAPLSQNEIGFEQVVQRDHALVKDKNYYELFGLTQGTFSFAALKEAYFAKTRLYSPEKFMELSGTTQGMAQEILSIFANAYNTLSNVVTKERYDEMLNSDKTVGLDGKQDDKLQAQIQFQSGKVFLDMGEFENAEKALQDAYTLEPGNALHCAYLGWAIYKNPASKNSQAALEKAKTLVGKSLLIEKIAEGFAFRGWMLLDEGRDGLAEGEFQKALKINPKEINARKGLERMAEKRDAEKKGFFRKIFG